MSKRSKAGYLQVGPRRLIARYHSRFTIDSRRWAWRHMEVVFGIPGLIGTWLEFTPPVRQAS